jgi:putative ABC transport system permease protein
MSVLECLRTALRALRINRLRSALTTLGIVIGVAAVITMVALGGGAHHQVIAQIRSLGANLLIVVPGSATEGAARLGAGTRHTLTEDDAQAIARQVPLVALAAPAVEGTAQIIWGNRNWSTSVVGAMPEHFQARDWQIALGNLFTAREVSAAGKLAILGDTVAERLFDRTDPLGATIRIKNVPFTVVGVLSPKGNNASGQDQDDIVFVPLSTAKLRLFGGAEGLDPGAVGFINVEVISAAAMDDAQRAIEALLRQRHRVAPDAPDDFTVQNMTAVFAAQREASRDLMLLLAAVASVSLLAGGINIMTMMLVSIAERTREIGVRVAVGARGRDIRNQFLIEAVTLCALGGLVGIALGAAAAVAFARLGGWLVFLSPEAMLVAFAVAAAVGVVSGLYPALRAARLDPIEALRYG